MLLKIIQLLITIPFFVKHQTYAATDKVICFYIAEESQPFQPEDIDITTCTHINYGFLGLKDDGSLLLGNDGYLRRTSALKELNPNLTVILSVGGYDEGSVRFSNIAAIADKKTQMAASAIYYLETYNCDGVDINWQYPARRGGIPEDKDNFIDMLTVLQESLSARSYLLTATVSPYAEEESYNIPELANVVDFINIMTYNYHPGFNRTGQNAPLYGSYLESEMEQERENVNSSLNRWIALGAPMEKIAMGLAFFGHSFQLADLENDTEAAPALGPGLGNGTLFYNQICLFTYLDGWVDVWNAEQRSPYKIREDQWIGYDSPWSIYEKVLYAKSRNLTGLMVWNVAYDDYNGTCGTKNELMEQIKNNL